MNRSIQKILNIHQTNSGFSSTGLSSSSKSLTKLVRFISTKLSKPQINGERTPLYDFHLENNAKFTSFAGFLLPVQYANLSVVQSHLHTRKHASLFDVSHMLQTNLRGRNAIECMERLCPTDIQRLPNGTGTLTVLLTDQGGIYDDLIVTKLADDHLYLVSNAGRRNEDRILIERFVSEFRNSGKDVSVEFLDVNARALIAIQGPDAAKILGQLCVDNLERLFFMQSIKTTLAGVPDCRITRCGYTGEDGFEISIKADNARRIVDALQENSDGKLELAGLGARDSLRLEAGLCLYGSDITEQTTPVEAGLNWLISKRRRIEGNFPGKDIIMDQLKNGPPQKRIGIRMNRGPPARHGIEVYRIDDQAESIGFITSGCPSPSLGGNVAMGYLSMSAKLASGTKIQLKVRDRFYEAETAKMPFLASRYYVSTKKD